MGVNLRTLIQSVDEILPTLHSSVRNEVGLLGGAVEELLLALLMEDWRAITSIIKGAVGNIEELLLVLLKGLSVRLKSYCLYY